MSDCVYTPEQMTLALSGVAIAVVSELLGLTSKTKCNGILHFITGLLRRQPGTSNPQPNVPETRPESRREIRTGEWESIQQGHNSTPDHAEASPPRDERTTRPGDAAGYRVER